MTEQRLLAVFSAVAVILLLSAAVVDGAISAGLAVALAIAGFVWLPRYRRRGGPAFLAAAAVASVLVVTLRQHA